MSRAPAIRSRLTVRVIDAAGAEMGGFVAGVHWSEAPLAGAWDVELRLRAEAERECAIRVGLVLEEPPEQFMVPGCLYPDAVPGSPARHPRWAAGSASEDPLAAPAWSFGSDRASHPAVMAWGARTFTAIAAAEADGRLGMTGLGLLADGGEQRIWLDFPAREEPVAFDGHGPRPAWAALHRWAPGEEATIALTIFEAPSSPHAYDPLLRLLYARAAPRHPLAPWIGVEEAAALAAEGLLRHHHLPVQRAIAETRGFEPGFEDRDQMHSAWLSGAPVAAALLAYGHATGHVRAAAAAEAVLDHLAEGDAPCGLPWGCWTSELGWQSGWTRPGTIHSRTAAETVIFMARAGRPVGRALDAVERVQRADGALPALFDAVTGEGLEWEGSAGVAWVAALAESGRLAAARAAGDFYANAVAGARLAGAPEDVPLSPTSEDGYAALMSYAALHRASGDARWLELARLAASWTMTFRWAHNLRWPEHTLLSAYGFRTRGADAASPANPHLHAYGLICLPELEYVAEQTHDDYLRGRARDNLACFRQMLARADGDFGARLGMATERYYNTRAFGPKGAILPVSHAWCLGALLLACTQRGYPTPAPAARPCAEPASPVGAAGSRSARRPSPS